MHEYVIDGGYPIQGKITASGNKNAALPCLTAALLTEEPVVLHNIPEIQDTNLSGRKLKNSAKTTGRFSAKILKLQSFPENLQKKFEVQLCLQVRFLHVQENAI